MTIFTVTTSIGKRMPNIKELIKKNVVGTQYEWESHFENIIYLCDKHLKAFRPDTILDVGCGRGDRTIRISRYFQTDLMKTYGLDANEIQIDECNKIFKAETIDLETSGLPYEDNTFDFVMCNQVLEHLKSYKKIVLEIIRVTKRNGYIILGVPNLAHLINRMYLLFGIQPMCIAIDSGHVRGFTHSGFINMLRALNGTKLIDYTGSIMYPLPYNIAKHLSKLIVGLSGYTCYLLRKMI